MTLYEVVIKLIGPVNPVGETNKDEERFLNLQAMTELVDKLLTDIDTVAYKNREKVEFSRKRAGEFAKKFLDKIGIIE